MFPFRRRASGKSVAGVYIDRRGIAVAGLELERGRKPRVASAAWRATAEPSDHSRALRALAQQSSLARQRAHLVLEEEEYQLLLVDAPRVEPSELRAAMRWRVKDLIDFHIDDAVIDVFEIPGQENRPRGQAMMYAVVARARNIRERIDLVEGAELGLEVIDVTEMALRNLAALLEEDARGVATLYLTPAYGIITLTRQGSLFLSRRLEAGTEALAVGDSGVLDQIVLEVQRSLDYYDSHFSQPPLGQLTVLPGFEGHDELVRWLDDNLSVNVSSFDAQGLLDCRAELDGDALGEQLIAIGGALRQEEISL